MTARRPLKASALFTVRRSGCVPAEPYPPNRTNRVAPGARLCYAFLNFRHANGGVQIQNKNRFYILARPFCCPALGERLNRGGNGVSVKAVNWKDDQTSVVLNFLNLESEEK